MEKQTHEPWLIESNIFSINQLKKLHTMLKLTWGNFPYADNNHFAVDLTMPDPDFEDLVTKGLVKYIDRDANSGPIFRVDKMMVRCYFLTDQGTSELKKIWRNFKTLEERTHE